MEVSNINLNIIRLKDQQCARLSFSTDTTFKSIALELEKAGIVVNSPKFDSWVFLNKYNDECYSITDEVISKYPIKNNGTLYILDTAIVTDETTNYQAMTQELETLRKENQSLRKAIDLLSRNM